MRIFKYMTLIAAAAASLLFCSCRNDWTIKDMPPVPEKAEGAGYVKGFETPGASIMIPVEVESAGAKTIVVRGRAVNDGTPGTGTISVDNSSAPISFDEAYKWSDCTVTLNLQAGVNNIMISGGDGNGAFQVDYIDLK